MSPRLQVALDARSLQGFPVGGVGRSTLGLIAAVRDEVELTLLTDGRRDPIDIDLPQLPLRAPVSRTKAAWLQLAVPRALRDFDGIFHCPWYGLPFRQPVPMVVTIHDLTFERPSRSFRPDQLVAYRLQARWAARSAAHVLTVSDAVRTELRTRYGINPDRLSVHPNALDLERMRVDPRRVRALRSRLGVNGRYAVAIGGTPRRRLDLALEAWPTVRAHAPDVTLVVLGPESFQPLPAGVVVAGAVEDADWAAALAGASVFLYPTEYEGFGYPALEAMAVGTPVVCARVGALPEVVGDAGCWFETHDAGVVANAVLRVLGDADLAASLGAVGRARAQEPTRDLIRERVLDAYDRAARRRNRTAWRRQVVGL